MLLALLLALLVADVVTPLNPIPKRRLDIAVVVVLILWLLVTFGVIGPLCLGARCG